MIFEQLAPDQNKNSCQQREHASKNADAKAGKGKDSNRDKINCKQKHADIFGNHGVSIGDRRPA